MVKAEVIFDGDLIYFNGLIIEKGIAYFVSNSDDVVVCDYVSLEEAVKYCLEN